MFERHITIARKTHLLSVSTLSMSLTSFQSAPDLLMLCLEELCKRFPLRLRYRYSRSEDAILPLLTFP